MDLCEVGTLEDLIDSGRRFEEEQIWKIITQLFIGLAVMNSHNLAHRDIKDCNIFIDNEDNIKIGIFFFISFLFFVGDFGESKNASTISNMFQTKKGIGTLLILIFVLY
jgi:serine/threonine protein kinase